MWLAEACAPAGVRPALYRITVRPRLTPATLRIDLRRGDVYRFRGAVTPALTGESAPVSKDAAVLGEADVGIGDRSNMLFQNTDSGTFYAALVAIAAGAFTYWTVSRLR